MTRDEAFKCCLEYFGGDTLAANVAVDKYLLNEDGNYLEKDLKDVFNRNIKELLRADEKYGDNRLNKESLEDIFYNNYAILQGSPLYGLGNNFARTTLSNCYVVESPVDSMSGIMNSAKELANLFKSRGGCGINLSSLRPEGAKVSNSAKVSTGAWSFASLFSDVTKAVGQCIAEDQTVLTRRGAKAIKDVAVGDLVWTKEGWISVVAVHKNGPKEVYKIKDKNGFSVETTLNHKFVTLNQNNKMEEIEVGELKEGDKIILIPGTFDREVRKAGVGLTSTDYLIELKTSTGYKNYIKENINAAFAIGCLLGFSHMHQIKLTEDGFFEMFFKPRRHYLVPIISAFLKKNFDIDVVVYQNDNKKFIRIDDPNFIAFLKECNFIDGGDGEVRQPVIPDIFKHAKFKIQIAFISGFSSMQRVFYPEGIQKTVYIFPNYKFATDYMQILMSFGIVFTGLRFVNGFWTLTLPQGSMVKKFTKMFSLIEIKNKVIVEQLRKANEENTIRKSQEHESVITPFKIGKSHISVGLFEKMGDKAPCRAPVVVSKLSSIEYVGIKETYDLELESEHLFYCNGFYVHNSGRRGALMEALHIQHPDAPKFITCKMDKKAVTSANISVMLSDEFMQAVESGEKFNHKWPVGSDNPKFTSVSDARELWGSFVRSNIASAEPGALFWDRMASYTPNASYDRFKPICVNPCAEVGMAANSNCRLMSINLLPFVINPYTELASFDFNKFADVVSKSVYILDNLVDLDLEKMKELADTDEKDVKELWYKFIDQTLNGREIGLGTHGLGDCLAAMGMVYGSDKSKDLTRLIYSDLCRYSYYASKELAVTRGAFLAYDEDAEKDNKFFEVHDWLRGRRRNISLLTSAPTGSISILHQVTSGIEPVFKRSYTRRRKVNKDQSTFTSEDGQHFEENTVYHHSIVKCKEILGEASKEYIEKYFVESHDIDPLKKVELLAIIQENIDHSISSTLNLPKGVPFEVVSDIYMLAWKLGLKGLTIYVEGSREGILVSEPEEKLNSKGIKERPNSLKCDIHHTTIKGEKWIVCVGLLDDKPYEVFCGLQSCLEVNNKFKHGSLIRKPNKKEERSIYDLVLLSGEDEIVIPDIVKTFKNKEHMVLGRMISLSLRQGGKLAFITEQLLKDSDSDFLSYNKVLSRILKKYIVDGEKPESGSCPECGGTMVYQGGCPICNSCGFSKCG